MRFDNNSLPLRQYSTPPSTPKTTTSASSSPGDSMVLKTPGLTPSFRSSHPLAKKKGFWFSGQDCLDHEVMDIKSALAMDGAERGIDGRMQHRVV
jgi:hypothetical protein